MYAYFTSIPKEKRIGYVFINYYTGRKCKEIKRAWKTVKQKANITNFRFHDLKHTVGTRLAQNNVPIPVIKEVLDHSDIKTTMRYVHTANEQILSAMNKLNSYNKDILQNP
jgi:integrase